MNDNPAWYVQKPYLHFDFPLNGKTAADYVSDTMNVIHHPFYPLLGYDLTTPRIKKCPLGSPKSFVKEQKSRPIAYPAHKDGYIFSYYKSILEKKYNKWLLSNGLGQVVTAFRPTGENNVSLAKKAFDFIEAHPGCQIVATDVESFFDKINHIQLKKTWASFLGQSKLPDDHYAVYKAITRYSVVERHKAYNLFGFRLSTRTHNTSGRERLCTPKQFREKVLPRGLVKPGPGVSNGIGIPQGTSLSPLLSNMYMADMDLAIHRWVHYLGGRYWRYCDDILIVTPDGDSEKIKQELDSHLKLLALTPKRGQNTDDEKHGVVIPKTTSIPRTHIQRQQNNGSPVLYPSLSSET